MGSTPRQHLTQLPLPTRNSEASSECFGRVILSYLREDEQADASFFILGDILHRTIEKMIINDGDLDDAKALISLEIGSALGSVGTPKVEGGERTFDSMLDDAYRMIENWFKFAHPDSNKRHPVYDDYQWPPKVEVEFHRSAASTGTWYPVWGSVDALYTHKVYSAQMIVDWKSGTQRQKSDFQLNFYRFGLYLPDTPAHFHHLDRVRKPSIVQEAGKYPGDNEIQEAILKTERKKRAVLKGYLPQFKPDWYCGYCPVQHLCPEDGDPRNRAENLTTLRDLLRLVEPMEEIERKEHVI